MKSSDFYGEKGSKHLDKINEETKKNLTKALSRLGLDAVHKSFQNKKTTKVSSKLCTQNFIEGRSSTAYALAKEEDRMGVFDLQSTHGLSPVTQHKAMLTLFKGFAHSTREDKSGSTLTACISHSGVVTVGWVGDSSALLAVKEKVSGRYVVIPLNWLHSPSDPDELLRIGKNNLYKSGGEYRFKHGARLNISRTIGDSPRPPNSGLISEPCFVTVAIPKGVYEDAVVLLHSDGGDPITPRGVEVILNGNYGITSDHKLARALRNTSLRLGSQDDISYLIHPVSYGEKRGYASYVADGHCGDETAEYVSQKFSLGLGRALKRTGAKVSLERLKEAKLSKQLGVKISAKDLASKLKTLRLRPEDVISDNRISIEAFLPQNSVADDYASRVKFGL